MAVCKDWEYHHKKKIIIESIFLIDFLITFIVSYEKQLQYGGSERVREIP